MHLRLLHSFNERLIICIFGNISKLYFLFRLKINNYSFAHKKDRWCTGHKVLPRVDLIKVKQGSESLVDLATHRK